MKSLFSATSIKTHCQGQNLHNLKCPPFFGKITKDYLISRELFFNRNWKIDIVEEMPPVDIVAGPVAGPASAARNFRPYLTIVPASSVHKAIGHIAFHPAPSALIASSSMRSSLPVWIKIDYRIWKPKKKESNLKDPVAVLLKVLRNLVMNSDHLMWQILRLR